MDPDDFELLLRGVIAECDINQYDAADILEKLADEQRLEGDDREEA